MATLLIFLGFSALILYLIYSKGMHITENAALQELNRTLEERNESLDRQNQLMERQYNMFATKPVITYLSEEQLSNLTRLVTATIVTIAKQTN